MSTVLWTAGGLLYLVGYLVALWRIAGQLAWFFLAGAKRRWRSLYEGVQSPQGDQWFGAITLALFLALAWPLSLPFAVLLSATRPTMAIFYTPPRERERLLQARIAQLEREAGIR